MQTMDKSEIARRHLGTALALYLDDADPVSVHTLACAGAEVADVLSETDGRTPFRLFRTLERGREITDREYVNIRNVYANAFKHARQHSGAMREDAKLLTEFNDVSNDERLFVAWFDFGCSGRPHPIESHVFQAWFLALHPIRLTGSAAGQNLLTDLSAEFPDLPSLNRDRQKKRLRRSIAIAKRDRKMMADSRIDQRPLILRG